MSGKTERKGRTQANVGRQVAVATAGDAAQLLDRALSLHQAGELARAKGLYEQIIERDPGHADALHFMGLACFQEGDGDRALALIHRAIENAPKVASFHDNLGSVLESRGALGEALDAYREAARLSGDDAERCFNMGVVLNRLDRYGEAEAAYRKAIELAPADGGIHYNLANLLKSDGRLEEAVGHYEKAIHGGPDSAPAATYAGALEIQPDDSIARVNLGNVQRRQSALEAAVASYAKVLLVDPGHDEARLAIGQVQRSLGRFDAALATFQTLLGRSPENSAALAGLASVLRFVPIAGYRPELYDLVVRCFAAPDVQMQDLAAVSAAQLRDKYALDAGTADMDLLLGRMADDPLLALLLTRTINVDPELEHFLTRARAHLIVPVRQALDPSPLLQLASAIACQCFTNEYVFSSSPEEQQQVARLRAGVERDLQVLATPDDGFRLRCALLAMFEPLLEIDGGAGLGRWDGEAWGEALEPLMERCVAEPLEERRLAEAVVCIAEVRDSVSVAVREQYEQHPYPRWLDLPRRAIRCKSWWPVAVLVRKRLPWPPGERTAGCWVWI